MDYFALMNGLAASRAGRQEMISDNVAEITNGLGPDMASREPNTVLLMPAPYKMEAR